ncbi:MAG: radical SAM protein, partial [Candidatus Muirbacterium halophilum]|nr:radical SAM protein [Candidatus Muirbacterium halophilum]
MKFDQLNSTLIIELTNMCNLNCIMCEIDRPRQGFMTIDLFREILNKIKQSKYSFNMFLPFWKGEPLLHPQFIEMMELYLKMNLNNSIAKNLGFDTNAHFLDKDISEFILKSNIFTVITFSIDAACNNTYSLIRGGDFEKILNNIRRFIKIKLSLNKKNPNIVFQFIVMEE